MNKVEVEEMLNRTLDDIKESLELVVRLKDNLDYYDEHLGIFKYVEVDNITYLNFKNISDTSTKLANLTYNFLEELDDRVDDNEDDDDDYE